MKENGLLMGAAAKVVLAVCASGYGCHGAGWNPRALWTDCFWETL